MKTILAAFALMISLIACNSQETQTDSTAVQVDSCAADSTCKDTCQTKK